MAATEQVDKERTRLALDVTAIMPSAALGIMQTTSAISLAAIVFAGPASPGLAAAASTFLVGSLAVTLLYIWRSSFEVVVAGARSNMTVVLASITAGVAMSASDVAAAPTVAAYLVLAVALSGVAVFAVGHFGYGDLVRYLPYPVMGGFLAGTAWLMLRGGFSVMVDDRLTLASFGGLFDWDSAQMWLPGIALAAGIVLLRGAVLQSLAILVSMVGFHAVAELISSREVAETDGWLLGPFEDARGLDHVATDLTAVEWSVVLSNAGGIAAVVIIALVNVLLNVSGVERSTGEDIEINGELKVAGVSSVVSGFGGGTVGFVSLGSTMLARRLGASSRSVGVVFALITALTVIAGPGLIGLMPRFVAGALVMAPGGVLIGRWVRDSMLAGPISDRVIAALIPLSIGFLGVLEGVGIGILAAAIVFVWRYSKINPVRVQSTAQTMRSNVERPADDYARLDRAGHTISILRLDGFLFFGSAARLAAQVQRLLGSSTTQVVLDFERVTGMDSSAQAELVKLARRCADANVRLCIAGLGDRAEHADGWLMEQRESGTIDFVDGADAAMEAAEDRLLDAVRMPVTADGADPTSARIPIEFFDRIAVTQGTHLIDEGEVSTDLYWIESGAFTVSSGGNRADSLRLRSIRPGSFVGEVGFFSGETRSATVRADTHSIVHRLDRRGFQQMVDTDPGRAVELACRVLSITSQRLTSANDLIRDLQT